MTKIEKLTNQTREIYRPPLRFQPAGSLLLKELRSKYARPSQKVKVEQPAAQQGTARPQQPRLVEVKPPQVSQPETKKPEIAPKEKPQPVSPPAPNPAAKPRTGLFGSPQPASPPSSSPVRRPGTQPPSPPSRTPPASNIPVQPPYSGRQRNNPPPSSNRYLKDQSRYRPNSSGMPPARKSPLQEKLNARTDFPVQIPMEPPVKPANPNNVNHGQNGQKKEDNTPTPLFPKNGKAQPAAPDANPTTERLPKAEPQPVRPAPQIQPLRLEHLLEINPGLPLETAVIGVSGDGLPVLVDLHDPTPGALLLIGDEREKHLAMLRSAVSSAAKRNSPRSMQFLVLSEDPRGWEAWVNEQGYDRHCLAIEDRNSQGAQEWIMRLADWTEQRRLGQRSGPPVLVIIDTLDFLPKLPYDVRLNFDWMVKEAPPARIWPIASINTNLALSIGSRMLRSFPGRVFGNVCNSVVYTRLGDVQEQDADQFVPPGEFAVKVGDDWLRFKVPG